MANSPHVLLVDDEKSWLVLEEEWLKPAGYRVSSAASSADALNFLRECETLPDCIVLDMNLGDDPSSGRTLCQTLKSSSVFQRIPVIFMSGRRDKRLSGIEAGAVNYLCKGCSCKEFLAVVRSVLQQRDFDAGVVRVGMLKLDPRGCSIAWEGKTAGALTPKPFFVLYHLARNAPRVISEAELLKNVLGWSDKEIEEKFLPDSRAIAMHLSVLRDRLPKAVSENIQHLKGRGYLYFDSAVHGDRPSSSRPNSRASSRA